MTKITIDINNAIDIDEKLDSLEDLELFVIMRRASTLIYARLVTHTDKRKLNDKGHI